MASTIRPSAIWQEVNAKFYLATAISKVLCGKRYLTNDICQALYVKWYMPYAIRQALYGKQSYSSVLCQALNVKHHTSSALYLKRYTQSALCQNAMCFVRYALRWLHAAASTQPTAAWALNAQPLPVVGSRVSEWAIIGVISRRQPRYWPCSKLRVHCRKSCFHLDIAPQQPTHTDWLVGWLVGLLVAWLASHPLVSFTAQGLSCLTHIEWWP